MGKVRTIKFNFIMNSILTASSIIFPLITYPYAVRIIEPDGVGRVTFVNSIITYFSMLAQLGIPMYGIKACARVRDNTEELSRTVQELLIINLITCVITYMMLIASVCSISVLEKEKKLFLVMSSLIFFNAIGVEWLYKGLEQYQYITVRSVIFKAIAIAAVILLVHKKEDYVIYGGISIFALVGGNILNFANLKRHIIVSPLGSYNFRKHIKPIMIFFAMSVATTIYTNLDTVMLGFIRGTTETGYYDAAVKMKNLLVAFVISLGTVLLPRVSYYIEKGNKKAFDAITEKALWFVLLISVPLTTYFIVFSDVTIRLLSGELFVRSILPMRIIMPTLVCIGLTNIMGIQILVPIGREKEVLYSEIGGAVINVVANSVLIPYMGAAGAAAGTLLAESVVLLIQVFFLRKTVIPILRSLPYQKLIAAVLLAALGSIWIGRIEGYDIAALAGSSLLFFGIYAGVLIVSKESLFTELLSWGINKCNSYRKKKTGR